MSEIQFTPDDESDVPQAEAKGTRYLLITVEPGEPPDLNTDEFSPSEVQGILKGAYLYADAYLAAIALRDGERAAEEEDDE